MSDPSQWHYTDKTGQQAGPVSTQDLQQLLSSKSIPQTSMVWTDGMPRWKPVNQIEELSVQPSTPEVIPTPPPVTSSSPKAEEAPAPNINPYEAPTIPSPEEYYSYETASFGGIGRLAYFLISIVASVAIEVGKFAMGASQYTSEGAQAAQQNLPVVLGFTALSIFISFFLMASRFKNIGMSRAWILGLFVPILNMFVSIWLISRQGGWVETRELDTAGKIIAWICWGLIILTIIAVAVVAVFAFQAEPVPQTSMIF